MILLKVYNGLTALMTTGTLVCYFIIARKKKMQKGKAKGLLILLPTSILVMTLVKDLCLILYLAIFEGISTLNLPIIGPIGKINIYYFVAGIAAFGWFPIERAYNTFKEVLDYVSPTSEQG